MSKEILVVIGGKISGRLTQDRHGIISFQYEAAYQALPSPTPLSLSMPVAQAVHKGRIINDWLNNLLPDNEAVLARWGAQYKVSPKNPFALMEHVGRDVAGAVQFVPEKELPHLKAGGIEKLSIKEIETRLEVLENDPAAWNATTRQGQFSLPGAQPKTALRLDGSQWGEPWGSEPTTHIIKPPSKSWAHQEINEHLCLATAAGVGIPTAHSEIRMFGTKRALVVERFDRSHSPTGLIRVHQEDLCQALGLSSLKKYEADRGPGPGPGTKEIISLFKRVMNPLHAEEANWQFISALALAWVIGGTDAHAKNYGLLLSGADVRLAPLYDLNSILPYEVSEVRNIAPGKISIHDGELAMKIGTTPKLRQITGVDWELLAKENGLDKEKTKSVVLEVISNTPKAMKLAIDALPSEILSKDDFEFAKDLLKRVTKQANLCVVSMNGRGIPARF
ncbi:MAG: type II toxin-antitoxin system HipA family toxin [Candidatus Planktophila sp.]|nr:type II toxin-antitoxin system HipA family toxin [Candidatus Planktophila sp.]